MTTGNDRTTFAERIRLAGQRWAGADGEADIQKERAETIFAELFNRAPDGSVDAKRSWARTQTEYQDARRNAICARTDANVLKATLESEKIAFEEWRSLNAAKRAELKAIG